MKKILIALILFSFLLPIISLAQEGEGVKMPETIEEAKDMVGNVIKVGQKELPGNMKNMFKEDVLPVWNKMYGWFKVNIWPKAEKEIKKREPALKEDVQKETGEMKEDVKKEVPKISAKIRILWAEFKNLINTNK